MSDSSASPASKASDHIATVEAMDKLERRGLICEAVGALLAEVYDVPHAKVAALA